MLVVRGLTRSLVGGMGARGVGSIDDRGSDAIDSFRQGRFPRGQRSHLLARSRISTHPMRTEKPPFGSNIRTICFQQLRRTELQCQVECGRTTGCGGRADLGQPAHSCFVCQTTRRGLCDSAPPLAFDDAGRGRATIAVLPVSVIDSRCAAHAQAGGGARGAFWRPIHGEQRCEFKYCCRWHLAAF